MKYSKGWKYRLEEDVVYNLKNPFRITVDDRWEIIEGGVELYCSDYICLQAIRYGAVLILKKGYCWDGATWFPDFDWVMTPSAIHDALHQLIREGIIEESENDLIDKEFADAIKDFPGSDTIMKFRASYTRRGTNLVNQRRGEPRKIYEISKLPREM